MGIRLGGFGVKLPENNNFWKSRNVFITGCTGLLGAWLTDELGKKGANVISLIRDDVFNSNLNLLRLSEKITRVSGPVEDFNLILRTINEYEIDTIFHLAAQTIVGTANKSPLSTFESNIRGTWNILEAARQLDISRIIIASSDKAYGSHEKLPYKEDARLIGSHPYDVSKTCADLISQAYYKTYKLSIGITRCGNLYGGGDFNYSRIIPGTIKSVIQNQPLIIRSDGSFVRDYFYVKDAVDSYLLLAEKIKDKNVTGEAFNFGTESPITVLGLVKIIINISGKKGIMPKILNKAHNEIRAQYLSCEKARSILKWHPKYSLKQGLTETYKWYADYFEGRLQ